MQSCRKTGVGILLLHGETHKGRIDPRLGCVSSVPRVLQNESQKKLLGRVGPPALLVDSFLVPCNLSESFMWEKAVKFKGRSVPWAVLYRMAIGGSKKLSDTRHRIHAYDKGF